MKDTNVAGHKGFFGRIWGAPTARTALCGGALFFKRRYGS
jgi:hypothetical protein